MSPPHCSGKQQAVLPRVAYSVPNFPSFGHHLKSALMFYEFIVPVMPVPLTFLGLLSLCQSCFLRGVSLASTPLCSPYYFRESAENESKPSVKQRLIPHWVSPRIRHPDCPMASSQSCIQNSPFRSRSGASHV